MNKTHVFVFAGEHPERYDYAAAQVPSALTDDVERRKQQRLAEKRKLQKQARKEKKKHEKVRAVPTPNHRSTFLVKFANFPPFST